MAYDEESHDGFFSRFFAVDQSAGFTTLAITGLAIFLSFALAGLWRTYRPQVMAGHIISADSIEITPTPPWIRSDIKNEVVNAAGLSGLSIRDEELTLRVAEAFRTHSWIANVKRVSKKHPANVIVALEYRQPIAMVEVADRTVDGQFYEGGLYPIDTDGVLLPTGDFSVDLARQFPRIAAREVAPMAPPGSPWGDARVHDGAVLAGALAPYWEKLGLYRIIAINGVQDALGNRDVVFRLLTRNNTMVLWGHAPGKEQPSEATVEKKISWMLKMKREKGSLDSIDSDRAIDLRDSEQLEVAARPEESVLQ